MRHGDWHRDAIPAQSGAGHARRRWAIGARHHSRVWAASIVRVNQRSPRTKALLALGLLAVLVAGLFVWITRDRSRATESLDRTTGSGPRAEQDRSSLAVVAPSAPSRAPLATEPKSNESPAASPSAPPQDDDELPCWLQTFDLDSGAPLEHVKITAELGIDQAISYTDEHGLARIEGRKTQMRLLQLDSFGYSSVFLDTQEGHERAERAWRIPMSRTATLIVHVRNATGAVVPDAQVTLESVGNESRTRHLTRLDAVSQGTITIDSNTDATGTVTIALLPAAISLQATVFQPRPWSPSEQIVLDPGEVRDLVWTVSGGCLLRGLLLDQDDHPVALRNVWLSREDMSEPMYFDARLDGHSLSVITVTTDEAGRFVCTGLDPATWWIGPAASKSDPDADPRASPDPAFDVAPLAQPVRIEDGQASIDVTLRVDRGLYIRGHVVDAAGAPAIDARIHAAELERRLHSGGRTNDADGSFVIGPLARGTYTIFASRFARDADSEPHVATAGESGLVLHLRAGAEFSGQVLGEDGVGVSAMMSVCDRESSPRQGRGMHTDQRGHFVIRGLSPGAFDVTATTDDGRIGRLERVGIAEGSTVKDVILRVAQGGRVRVRHTGPETAVNLEVLQNGALIQSSSAMRNMPVELIVPAGTVEIRALHVEGDRRTVERSVSVAVGETVDVVLEAGAH